MMENVNQLELFHEYLNTEGDFAIYAGIQNVKARAAHKAMRDVIKNLTTPFISPKKDVALIGPYKLGVEASRANANVISVSALIFDIDEPQKNSFESIVELASAHSGVLHTTWSHTEEKPKYRLIINLSSEIPASEFQGVRDGFLTSNPWLATIADKACSDISRAYYLFSHPQERANIARCCVLIGRPVNPSTYSNPAKKLSALNSYKVTPPSCGPAIDVTTLALMGKLGAPSESAPEVAKLKDALSFLSSDTRYGTGKFYDSNGRPESEYWLAAIWAVASLNWPSGKEIACHWSEQSIRFTDAGFEKAWNSYNPAHTNGIGIGSLYKRAKELGWNQGSSQPQLSNSNLLLPAKRFTLLGINDLTSLPPTKHLVKGILPSSGLAAIYGPSGSGKTFLALDLIMAIACQSDWFGHKVKNVPVTYLGLEGKGGINIRIQAWCIKNPTLTPTNFKIILDNFDLLNKANVIELAQTITAAQMHQGVIVIDTLNQASPAADENSSQDMGAIIKHLKLLQEMTGGLVLIIHHTGKNTSQGLRGHSSLKAALDANIEVVGGDKRSWLLEKSKDGEDGKSFGFRLDVQRLGTDGDGDPITSCTVERDHSVIFTKPEPSGSKQKVAFKAIKQALTNSSDKRMTVEAVVSEIANSLPTIAANKRNNNARQLLGSLIGGGFLSSELINDEGWVWLA